jgi:hypothetical protein
MLEHAYPDDTKAVFVVSLLESLIRAQVSARTVCRDALIKHDAVVTVITTADPSLIRAGRFAMADHGACLCPALTLHKDV